MGDCDYLDGFHQFTNPFIVKFSHIGNGREILSAF